MKKYLIILLAILFSEITHAFPEEISRPFTPSVNSFDCNVVTLPHRMGFEYDEAYECWTSIYSGTINIPERVTNPVHSGSYSWQFSSYNDDSEYDQYLISPELPIQNGITKYLSFYYKEYFYGSESFRIGYSTTDNQIGSFVWLEDVTDITVDWQFYENYMIPSEVKYIAIHYNTSSNQYYLYIDDITIDFIDDDFPRSVTSRTPDINEVSVENDALVSVTFNMNINAIDLSAITITPDPGGISASISENVLTIAHEIFLNRTEYTVTIPEGSIENVAGDISWSFTTTMNCSNITYPYTIGFNDMIFPPDCWSSESSTSAPWKRVTSGTHPVCSPSEGEGMIQYNCHSYSTGKKGILISPPLNNSGGGLTFGFNMYRDNAISTSREKVNIYFSETPAISGSPVMTIHRNNTLSPESATGWNEYLIGLPTNMPIVYIIVEGESNYGYNIYMDNFVIASAEASSREVVSRTPDIDEINVAIDTEVSVTFNLDITAIDLTNITITPDPDGVSASISGNKLTIAHENFDYLTPYTVTIPAGSIENVSEDISWSFTTTMNCTNSTYPYTIDFNDTIFPPECWTINPTTGNNSWKRDTSGYNPFCSPYEGAGMIQFASYSATSGLKGYLISPPLDNSGEPLAFSFYMYRDDGTYSSQDQVNIYFSETLAISRNPAITIHRNNTRSPVSDTGWNSYSIGLPTDMLTVYIIVEGVSDFGYNIYMDHFVISSATDLPREVFSRTPDVDELGVAIGAEVSVTFNLDITAIELTNITILPDPGGVSASISGKKLTIAHENFDYLTPYTVTIPAGSIENVADEISWSFTTMRNCSNITYPYTIDFNNALFPPDCWQSISFTSTPWKRVISGTHPTCSPIEGIGMIEYDCYHNDTVSKGLLVSPPLDNSGTELAFNFYMYRDSNICSHPDKVNIYFSETLSMPESPAVTIHRCNTLSPASAAGWNSYSIGLPTEMSTVYIIIEGESNYGNNIYMDHFVVSSATNLPREVLSRTPDVDDINVAIDTEVSATFNLDITAINLTNITITPDPGGISASISGKKLTINHGDFDYFTTYTVTIPAGSIENVDGEISWSFRTIINCSDITYPHTTDFNDATFPPNCWMIHPTTGDNAWTRQTIGYYPSCSPHEGAGMIEFLSYWATSGLKGYLASPSLDNSGEPLAFRFYMYRDDGESSSQDKVNIYFSETLSIPGTPAMTIHRNNTLAPASAIGWNSYSIELPTDMPTVYIIIEGESDFGNSIYMDHFVIAPAADLIHEIVSRTPDIDEVAVAINAEVSATFNLEITAIDLTNITITPDPGGVSASISGNKLTINHDDFDDLTPYTVTIPAGSIENVTDEISWSFTTTINCSNITYPYTIDFNDTIFPPECWTINPTTGNNAWTRQTSGSNPSCSPHEGIGMTQFFNFWTTSGLKGHLISPSLDNSGEPLIFNFYMYRDDGETASQDKVNIYFSETPEISGTPAMTIHRCNTLSPVSETGWNSYSIGLPTDMPTVYIIVEGESDFGNNIYMDKFVVSTVDGYPREIVSRTPDVNEMRVPIDAEVSVTFNLDLTAIDLTNITITPDPGGVSASISGTTLTIAHNDFDLSTTYTVTIPIGSIEYITRAISWSFTTSFECFTITLPYTMGFEAGEPYECWESIYYGEMNEPGIVTNFVHSGSQSWQFSSFDQDSTGYDQYLISPQLPVTSKMKSLSFWYRKYWNVETFRVGYSSTNKNLDSFTWMDTVADGNFAIWEKFTLLLPAETKYVAIHYTSVCEYYIYVDDISIHYANQLTSSVSHYHDYGTTPTATITPENTSVIYDDSKEVTITIVDSAYDLHALLMTVGEEEPVDITNAATQTENVYRYMVNNITEDIHIEAVIKVNDFSLNFTVQSGKGEVNGIFYDATTTPQTFQQTVNYEYSLMLDPDHGYLVGDLIIDAASAGTLNQYDFEHIISDHQVEIYFTPKTFIITTEVIEGEGSISQGDTFLFDPDYVYEYTILPDEGYLISSILINGDTVEFTDPEIFTGTLENIIENYLIEAYFTIKQFTVTATAHEGGSINPEGTAVYDWNSSPEYTATPSEGYYISEILLDGEPQTIDDNQLWSYTFTNINADHTIEVTFDRLAYTITVIQGENGTIAPGTSSVYWGESMSFTITPDVNYEIENVIVDGVEMGAISNYTFTDVREPHTITATMTENIQIPCEKPSNLYAGDITHESAILHWDATGAESYIVEHKAIEDPNYTTVASTTNQYAYTNLLEQTTYVWRVMAVCEIGYESEWTELSTFTTLESSIRDNALSQISVYAHQNHVNIVNEAGIVIKQIDIFDIYGRQIYRGKTSESREIITLSVTSGTYMVKLVTNQGVGVYKVAIIW